MQSYLPSKNGPFSCQGNHFVSDVNFRYSVVACNDVSEVSGVSLVVSGCAVSAPFGVVVRPGAGATVCVVTELVNVETVLARCKAFDFSAQLNGILNGGTKPVSRCVNAISFYYTFPHLLRLEQS